MCCDSHPKGAMHGKFYSTRCMDMDGKHLSCQITRSGLPRGSYLHVRYLLPVLKLPYPSHLAADLKVSDKKKT